MGLLINEQQFMEDNARDVVTQMNSPLNKYTDKTTTFVKYWHINGDKTTINEGFEHVERIIGKNSPIRYNRIDNVPLLGIENIVLAISDEEQGLDMDYEGDAFIQPGVLEPYENDMFAINHLGQAFLFYVTSVEMDTVKAHNFYKINFALWSVDDWEKIDDQVVERYTCIYNNIGTDNKCIIRNDEYEVLQRLDKLFVNIMEAYKLYFYDKKFNSFLCHPMDAYVEYDAYINKFISSTQIFRRCNDLTALITVNENYDPKFEQRYDRSIFNAIVKRNLKWFQNRRVSKKPVNDLSSTFKYFHVENVAGVHLDKEGSMDYLPMTLNDLLDRYPILTEEDVNIAVRRTPLYKLIARYFYDEDLSITNIDLDELEKADFDFIEPDNIMKYRLIPLLLYILKFLYDKAISMENYKGTIQ